MPLPFTREQFFDIFAAYNAAVWPAQWVAGGIGVIAVVATLRDSVPASRVVSACLAAMWLWTGVVYHAIFFASINGAARIFAGLFVLQGLAFVATGVVGGRLFFSARGGAWGVVGWALIVYAGLIYPLIGLAAGHASERLPLFGITPCPVTIFTVGLLLLARPPLPAALVVIPALWSLIGGSAALLLGVPQDWMLPVAGVLLVASLRRTRAGSAPAE